MQSPIEERLLAALLEHVPDDTDVCFDGENYGASDCPMYWVLVERDVRMLTYRADFLLSLDENEPYKLAVECDGHEFHDRTKQQAAYDRARDRELLTHGIVTIRFTGSEIYHDTDRCAVEVYRCFRFLRHIYDSQKRIGQEAIDQGMRQAREFEFPGAAAPEEHW